MLMPIQLFLGGVWSFVAVTHSGSLISFYFNGQANGSHLHSGTFTQNDVALGIGGSSWLANSLMDDMHIYNRALSAAEIQAIYNATK